MDFTFLYAYSSNSSQAARISTLFHIIKTAKAQRHPTTLADRLLQVWRGRLLELRDEGLSYLQDTPIFMTCYNCTPSMLKTDCLHTYRCHRSILCPWCYANDVSQLYRRVRDSVAEIPSKTSKLILARKRYRIAVDEDLGKMVSRAIETQKAAYKRFNAIGGYAQCSVGPSDHDDLDYWHISSRILAIGSTAPTLNEYVVKEADITDKSMIARTVGSTFKYPRGLLTGDAYLAREWLDMKSEIKIRLSATYGKLRQQSK